jgi:Ca2+-binding RTX toxin-like protein
MTVAQNTGLQGSATVANLGQSVTLTDAGTTTAIAGIETYILSVGPNDLTTGSAGVTVNANALINGQNLTLNGTHTATVTLVAGDLTSASTGNLTVTATTGSNIITTGAGVDLITGGSDVDDMTGGNGADTFVFAAGDSGTISGTVFDIVRDYIDNAGGDSLDLVGVAQAEGDILGRPVDAAADGGPFVVTADITNGIITVAGANAAEISTLAEWLAVARLMVTTDGRVGAFEFGGDTYVYQENAGGDLFIQLDNVIGITAVGITAAADTVLVA